MEALLRQMSNSNNGYWALAVLAPPLLYTAILGLTAIPFFQRHAVYAHKVNDLLWNDITKAEKWGFAKGQVTPFSLKTPDGETINAWHIVPLRTYAQHEGRLSKQQDGQLLKFTTTESFKLLRDTPGAKLILTFHGNAGHLAQNMRPAHYHSLTDTSDWHVIAMDYRGYGHSSGKPSEEGLITDASTFIEFAVNTAGISPDRIVLIGHSLGTAVASAVAEKYSRETGTEFAGVVLVASFSSLPTMLAGYAIAGMVPILSPLRICPPLLRLMLRQIVDKWTTLDRITALVSQTLARGRDGSGGRLRLSLVHAANDWDIPCLESTKIFDAAARAAAGSRVDDVEFVEAKDSRTEERGQKAFKTTWSAEPDVLISHEQYPYGGHNSVLVSAPIPLAVMSCFAVSPTND